MSRDPEPGLLLVRNWWDEGHGTVIFPLENVFLRLLRREEAESEMLGLVAVADPQEQGSRSPTGRSTVRGGVRNAAFTDPDGHVWQFASPIPGS